MPLVSVIIATKNEEKNISRCLDSIENQTYKNFEIIVVDNNSKDKTKEIARKFTKLVFNCGPERSAQRNFGAQKAKGKILIFLDADMEIMKEVFLKEVSGLENKIEKNSFIIPEISKYSTKWDKFRAYYRSFIDEDPSVLAPRVFSKKNFLGIGGYDEKLNACEDWDIRDRISKITSLVLMKGRIYHNEKINNLYNHLKKKFYYATYLDRYLKKKKSKTLNKETVFFLRPSYKKMLLTFSKNPVDVIGSTALLFLEMMAGAFGYYYGKYTSR